MIRKTVFPLVLLCITAPSFAISFDDLLDSYGNLETVAGTGLIPDKSFNGWLDSMEGGDALEAELSRPHMTMADELGNLYIADKDAHAIRLVTPDGTIHTIAGTNVSGYNGDGFGTEVELSFPNGLYTFPDGTTYILDLGNSLIRKLDTDGNLTTIIEDFEGISIGRGLWVSPDESLIYYSSGWRVRKWTPDEGLTTYAEDFIGLGNLHVDPSDQNLVVTDREGHGVYKVFEDGGRELIAGNETTSGGGTGFHAVDTGLKEVRGIYFHPQGGYFLATHDGGQVWFVDEQEIIHLLIDGDDDGTHAGDGLPLSSFGKKISEPRAVTLAPNGDLIVTEHDAGFIRYAKNLNPFGGEPGDFNFDRVLDVADIELLSAEVREGTNLDKFDLNDDGKVDQTDRAVWVNQLKNTYFGDSNLDGEFNSRDFVFIFQKGEYEDGVADNSDWADGDWNGDREFDSADFVIAFKEGGYEMGPRQATSSVPEPSLAASLLVSFLAILGRSRRGIVKS